MNWTQIEGKWHQLRGELHSTWGKLTDDDIDVIAGKRDVLLGKLQERYGYEKARAEKSIDEFLARIDDVGGPKVEKRPRRDV